MLSGFFTSAGGTKSTIRVALAWVLVGIPVYFVSAHFWPDLAQYATQFFTFCGSVVLGKCIQVPFEDKIVPAGDDVIAPSAPVAPPVPQAAAAVPGAISLTEDRPVWIDTVAGHPIHKGGGIVSFIAPMEIDADGAPHAYNPSGTGLDANKNAKDENGDWVGIAETKDGNLYIQGEQDPAPGFYVSTTALQNPAYPVHDPRRYVNSELVNFFVLPGHKFAAWGVKLGASGSIKNLRNGKTVHAIFADVGPSHKLGEASIAAAKALGVPSSPRVGGESAAIFEYRVEATS